MLINANISDKKFSARFFQLFGMWGCCLASIEGKALLLVGLQMATNQTSRCYYEIYKEYSVEAGLECKS